MMTPTSGETVLMSRRKLVACFVAIFLAGTMMASFVQNTTVASRSLSSAVRSPPHVPKIDPSLSGTDVDPATRILVTIPSFGKDNRHYLEDMMDSFRDMCEAGLQVTLVLYLTTDCELATDEIFMLNARMQCRNVRGSFRTKVVYQKPTTGNHFAAPHRDLLFENADKFDLFIYIEDDMMIRLEHIVAYLEETAKLKTLIGQEDFLKFSVGFLRYEVDPETKDRSQFEHPDGNYPIVEDPRLQKKYMTHPSSHHHQAMYMATREQLLGWKDACECFRDTEYLKKTTTPVTFRETLSSCCLFAVCSVMPVLPRDSFQDLMIHHMSDKYMKANLVLRTIPDRPKLPVIPAKKILKDFAGYDNSKGFGRPHNGFTVDI